jgi:hypothetical protein
MIASPASFRAWAIALSLALLFAIPAAAQDQPMELRSSADYVYGQSMNFHLAATNVGDVESVTLFIRLGVSPDSYAVEVPIAPEGPIDLSYALDLSQTRLPPFGSITYWWELERPDGSPLRVPEQVISYVDDQFSWRQLAATDPQGGGSVRIHWTGDDEALGDQARDIIYKMLPPIGRLIPLDHIVPFDVYIYPSSADLGAALRLAGREYTPGQTYPDLGVVLGVVVNPETAEAELRRELSRGLVDLLLYQGLNQFAYNVPPWLGRGLAGAVRGQRDPSLEEALQAALNNQSTIPLAELCAGMAIDSELAAAQSEAILAYIQANYGEEAVRTLVTAFAGGDDCPAALQKALQMTPEQLDAAWQRTSSGDQGTRAVAEIAIWLALVLAGFGLAGLLLLRPRRV